MTQCLIPILLQTQEFSLPLYRIQPDVNMALVSKSIILLRSSTILFTAHHSRLNLPSTPLSRAATISSSDGHRKGGVRIQWATTYWLPHNKHHFTKPFHKKHFILSSKSPYEVSKTDMIIPILLDGEIVVQRGK